MTYDLWIAVDRSILVDNYLPMIVLLRLCFASDLIVCGWLEVENDKWCAFYCMFDAEIFEVLIFGGLLRMHNFIDLCAVNLLEWLLSNLP